MKEDEQPKRRRSTLQKETDAIAEITRVLKSIKIEQRVRVMRAVDAMLGGQSGHNRTTPADISKVNL